jgi:acetylornithine deacetylase/succinyl-diaminopimelate desuccinylase-like protein
MAPTRRLVAASRPGMLRRTVGLTVALACTASTVVAQGFDQKAMGRTILRELIETNTTPSVGNTTRAAELVAGHFRSAGIPATDIAIVGPDDTHKNLVVRVRGRDRAAKPILFLAHLDVVEAERSDWSLDPFTFTERDGFYYGRGTQDIKGGATTFITALLRLKAEGITPERDLILALTAGEEGGMPNGVEWLLANRRDLVDAEYCVNVDGGNVDSEQGRPVAMNMQAAEKVYFDVKLTARNKGGHSSLPRPDNAINTLARALTRIANYRFPVQFNEITRAYFQRSAAVRGGQLGADLKAAAAARPDTAAIRRLSADPWFNAQMRTTCVTTMLSGGHAPNALPQTATANVNCRRLPGLMSDSLVKILKRVIADTSVTLEVISDAPQSPPSPLRADVEAAVRSASTAIGRNIPLLPTMETGATDGLYFRNAGIPTYGLNGIAIDTDDVRMHGRDERVNIGAFERGQEFAYQLIRQLAVPVRP